MPRSGTWSEGLVRTGKEDDGTGECRLCPSCRPKAAVGRLGINAPPTRAPPSFTSNVLCTVHSTEDRVPVQYVWPAFLSLISSSPDTQPGPTWQADLAGPTPGLFQGYLNAAVARLREDAFPSLQCIPRNTGNVAVINDKRRGAPATRFHHHLTPLCRCLVPESSACRFENGPLPSDCGFRTIHSRYLGHPVVFCLPRPSMEQKGSPVKVVAGTGHHGDRMLSNTILDGNPGSPARPPPPPRRSTELIVSTARPPPAEALRPFHGTRGGAQPQPWVGGPRSPPLNTIRHGRHRVLPRRRLLPCGSAATSLGCEGGLGA